MISERKQGFSYMWSINTVWKVRSRVHSVAIEALPGMYMKNDVNYGARRTQHAVWYLRYK